MFKIPMFLLYDLRYEGFDTRFAAHQAGHFSYFSSSSKKKKMLFLRQ